MQRIHINRNRVNSIEFDNPEITIHLKPGDKCNFEIPIINYGYPTHVHISASESLKDNIKFLHNNPYVANQEWIPIMIILPGNTQQARGKIKVTTGYGSYTETFKVFIGKQKPSSKLKPIIEIDEKLGTPVSYNKPISNRLSEYSNVIMNYFGSGKKDAFTINSNSSNSSNSFNSSNIIIRFLITVIVVIVMMFIISILWNINPLYGAIVISIIVIIFIAYVITHLLIKE